MRKINPRAKKLKIKIDQKGQSLVEYLILTALLAVSTMAILRVMGHSISGKFAQITKVIQGRDEGSVEIESVTDSQYRKKDMSNFMSGASKRGK